MIALSVIWLSWLCLLVEKVHASPYISHSRSESLNWEEKFSQQGLVDLHKIDQTIQVELKYSTSVYGELEKCFLQKEVALKLVEAQKKLRSIYPKYSLKVFDGTRPRRIQIKMWKLVEHTPQQEYVANPQKGSMHNYGAALDVTIVDKTGKELDMGTPYDFFGDLAKPELEERFLKQKKLSKEHIKNRKILRKVMIEVGFLYRNEWWHFEVFPKEEIRKNIKLSNRKSQINLLVYLVTTHQRSHFTWQTH